MSTKKRTSTTMPMPNMPKTMPSKDMPMMPKTGKEKRPSKK